MSAPQTPPPPPAWKRRAQLRRQVELLTEVRDRMDRESGDDYEAWAIALTPLTDRILHELAKLEDPTGYVPYPHPMSSRWWYVPVTDEATPTEKAKA